MQSITASFHVYILSFTIIGGIISWTYFFYISSASFFAKFTNDKPH